MARGQITVFIIIGIVLLAGFGLITYFVNFSVEESLQTEALPVMTKVSQEFEPVQDFVTNCMRDALFTGIKKMSAQGGYLYPDLLGTWNPEQPYDSAGVMLGNQMIPYWSQSQIAVVEGMARRYTFPPLTGDDLFSIESQLESYSNEYVTECLNNFAVYQSQFDITSGQHDSTIRIQDGYVEYSLSKNVQASIGGSETVMTSFLTELDTELYSIYQAALDITAYQHSNALFENVAIESMILYQGLDADRLPPFKHTEVGDPIYAMWNTYSVQNMMRDILTQHIPTVRYFGNPDAPRTLYDDDSTGIVQSTYDKFVFPLENGQHYVRFDYFGFTPYVDLNGGQSMVSGSQIGFDSGALPFISLDLTTTEFQTTYDVSFPVMVSIDSPRGISNTPLQFMFALEGLINNNEPVFLDYGGFTTEDSLNLQLTCDPRQHPVHMNVTVIDYATREPMDAELSWTVDGAGTCYAGETGGDEMQVTTTKSSGVTVTLRADGYLTQNYVVDMYENITFGYTVPGQRDLVLPMYPEKTVGVNLSKRLLEKCVDARSSKRCQEKVGADAYEECMRVPLARLCTDENLIVGLASSPAHQYEFEATNTMAVDYYVGGLNAFLPDVEIMYIMERLYDEYGDTPLMYGADHTVMLSHLDTNVTLYPGTYKVFVTAVRNFNDSYTFAKEQRCSSTKAKSCTDIDAYNLSSIPLAIYEIPDFVVESDDLYASSHVEFPIMGLVVPQYQQIVLDYDKTDVAITVGKESLARGMFGYYGLIGAQMPETSYNVSMIIGEEFDILNQLNGIVELYPNSVAPRWTYE